MKKGVSLVSLVIVIIIMVILAGIVVIQGFESNENITIDTFALEILDVQNGVDEYYYRHQKYPSGDQYILDTTKVEALEQFANEEIVENGIDFKIVDLSLIGINSTEYGSGKGKDIYVLSEKTGIVYYLEGVKFKDKTYYTLTDELYEITNANNSDLVSTQDIKVYNVIFRPSTTEYTNKPVTVTIKIPKIAVINSVTTTNNKSVGMETVEGLYKQIQVNETSTDKTGNYKITVNYTYRGTEKTSEYEVTNYDANLPGITYKETVNGDLKTVNVTINDNNSKIKTVKYEQEIVSQISYFKNYGKAVTNNKFVIEKDAYFTIYIETESGTNLMVNNMPENWKANVIDIVDGVPIPKGFVASSVIGENKKDTGLVIYEGTDEVTAANVYDAKRERNQYVWVPISSEDFMTKFVRQNFGIADSVISNTIGEDYWEVELDTTTNMPLSLQDTNYITDTTLDEVQAMYESVKEYEGFYIARYEAGIDVQRTKRGNEEELPGIKEGTKVYSVMGKIPYIHIPWTWNNAMNEDTYGAVEVSRRMYPNDSTNKTGVVSTLTYGVQWDAILEWWLDTNAVTNLSDSTKYGNYSNCAIEAGDLNSEAKYAIFNGWGNGFDKFVEVEYDDQGKSISTKPSMTDWGLSTGALENAKVNNIYDMAGNFGEWTMEGNGAERHVARGGFLSISGSYNSVFHRSSNNLYYANDDYSFRTALYIKK